MSADPLSLSLSRHIKAPPSGIWKAWSDPRLLERWWCPAPWRVEISRFGFEAGGAFDSTMHGPDGEEMPARGCFLLVEAPRRIVFTTLMAEGFHPIPADFAMTAIITLTEKDGGTDYGATVLHRTAAETEGHRDMGFHDGWGAALNQLAALVE